MRSLSILWFAASLCSCASLAVQRPGDDGVPSAQARVSVDPALATADAPGERVRSSEVRLVALDAEDEHAVSLRHLLERPWKRHSDRGRQLQVGLPDGAGWRRVRLRPFRFFTGFKYGDDYRALEAVRVQPVPAGRPVTSRTCLREAERWALPKLKSFDVRLTEMKESRWQWRDQTVQARTLEAHVDYAFTRSSYSVAWMAVPAYTDGCLVLMFAVRWGSSEHLARQVRDRWLQENLEFLRPKTPALPIAESS